MPELPPAFLETADLGKYRVRPFRPYDPVTEEEVAGFLREFRKRQWTQNATYLTDRLVAMSPLERLNFSVKSVLFRLYETDGEAQEPCLSGEEHAFLEEIWYSHLPESCKSIATRLLCVKERYVLTRIFRGSARTLSHGGSI